MSASDIRCEVEGCTATAANATIHRTSPKGKGLPFRGRCEGHLHGTPDETVLAVTDLIEIDNLYKQGEQL